MIIRRVTFNLNAFLEELEVVFSDELYDQIDDTIQRYKDFLSWTNEDIRKKSMTYIENHPLFIDNQKVNSFVTACHKPYFEK